MPFEIINQELASVSADAIVYADTKHPFSLFSFNPLLLQKEGKELLKSRESVKSVPEGEAKIIPASTLEAKYIIHTSAPVWHGGLYHELGHLRSCYEKSFALAVEHQCKSIAVPIIATDNLGYPKKVTQQMAFECIRDFLLTHDIMVYLVVPKRISVQLPGNHYSTLNTYIRKNYVENKDESYNPDKRTIIARGMSLKLSLDEMKDSLKSAGCTLSHDSKFDLIIEYCILHNIYDVFDVNLILFRFEQEQLG